ncbi:MAG: hypothetical protein EOO48_14370, partial [Flavobacterium sp.]
MEILFTKDAHWLQKWDAFILTEDKGSHLLLSDWISSYQAYGFDSEFCLMVEDGKIIGGYAAVVAKAVFFKFYIVPYGPIVTEGFEHLLDDLIAAVPNRGKLYGACYSHIALPLSDDNSNKHIYSSVPELQSLADSKPGHLFKFVYSSSGLNWVPLSGFENEEALLESFKSSVRRDIRSSVRKELSAKFLKTESEVKAGYQLCLQNATKNGYALRDWESFRSTLMALIS